MPERCGLRVVFRCVFGLRKVVSIAGWIDVGDGATCKAPTGYGGNAYSRDVVLLEYMTRGPG